MNSGTDAFLISSTSKWISTKPLAELCQVFEINGTCSTDPQDLVCLALFRSSSHQGRERSSNLKNYLGKLGLFLVAVVPSAL
jgi:hypothetical protein